MIWILTASYNRKNITSNFVKQLKSQEYKDWTLVLIDDDSSDDTVKVARTELSDVQIIQTEGNVWWAGSIERGLAHISTKAKNEDIVCIINDDVLLNSKYLLVANELLPSHGSVLVSILCENGMAIERGVCIDWMKLEFRSAMNDDEINCFSTRGIFVRWRDLKFKKLFIPHLLPHYLSDYDFSIRLIKQQLKVMTNERVYLEYMKEQTGIRSYNNFKIGDFLKNLFTKRNSGNPVYMTIFFILNCPNNYLLKNIYRIWRSVLKDLIKSLVTSFNSDRYSILFFKFFLYGKKVINKSTSLYCSLDHGWIGSYENWGDAEKQSDGYNKAEILDKCRNSLLEVKNGFAVYERDSVLFNKIEYSWPLVSALLLSAANQNLNVLDFGGSLGSTYFQNVAFLKNKITNLHWGVVEQEEFVKIGLLDFESDELCFYYSIKDYQKDMTPHIVVLSSVLQYIKDIDNIINEIINTNAEYIFIDLTPVQNKHENMIVVQKVPPEIYNASYPCWIFNESWLMDKFTMSYTRVEDFNCHIGQNITYVRGTFNYKGYLFRRKN